MAEVKLFRSQAQIVTLCNLAEFIRYCREELTWLSDRQGFAWDAPVWPLARWCKLSVGKRRDFTKEECLDAEFIDFAKAYFRWKQTEQPTKLKLEVPALKCLDAALLTVIGSGAVGGLTGAVLDEAASIARQHFSDGVRYQVGRSIRNIARFVNERRLIALDVSTWKSPLPRPSSVRRTGDAGRAESERKLPSAAGLDAMAEIFANDFTDPQFRWASAVWALLLSAPWRITEILRLHVEAEYEEADDHGSVSYGLRYYGAKGFEYDIKWVPKVLEPIAREAFRRIKEMTESARGLARHLEARPEVPFRYSDAPRVSLDATLSLEEKAALLRREVPKSGGNPTTWGFRSVREHWQRAVAKRPEGFPVFDGETGVKWSEALFCMHRNFLHETRGTDWYQLSRPTANTMNDLLKPTANKKGVPWKLRYREPDGREIRLTTHQARHYLSTIAERGSIAQEDLAKWAGRAMVRDNRVYNHRSERELTEQARTLLAKAGAAEQSTSLRINEPTTRAEFNLRASGPTHQTAFGACEHDWTMSPCMKHGDCICCAEHVYEKGDPERFALLKARCEHRLQECEKALAAIRGGTQVADRWLEHQLKSLMREMQLVSLLECGDIEAGAEIRLNDDSAEHTHLRRALDQRLPGLRDRTLPARIAALIERCTNGEALVGAAGDGNRRNSRRMGSGHEPHVGRTRGADGEAVGCARDKADAGAPRSHQVGVPSPKSEAADGSRGRE